MSRLAASSAAELANDLSHALDVSETTNAELKQQLEEAEAVIAKVRGERRYIATRKAQHYERWNDTDSKYNMAAYASYSDVLDRLDGIDGL